MKTVSTLCATSTVGIAACGYALARPYTGNDLNDHLTNAPIHPNSFIPPLIRKTTASPNGNGFRDIGIKASRQEEKQFPSLPTNFSRPSTSRKWLRRLSESFSSSSSSGTTSPTTSTASSTPSSSRSQSTSLPASAPNSRPPTRNKLHRQRLSASPTVPSPLRRPSTAIHQSPPAGKSSHLTPIHASRPSTSAPESSPPPRLPTQEPVASWRVFFSAKRQKARSSSAAGGKLTKLAGIRRIYPNRSRQDLAPTLVLAPALEASEENDTGSLFSAAESLFIDSRPGTRMDNHHPPSLRRPSTSVPPLPKRRVQRAFSISSVITAPDSQKPSQGDTDVGEIEGRSCFAQGYSMDSRGVARRFSESSLNPRPPRSIPPSPMPVGESDQLPPIQSLSSLELGVAALPATSSSDTELRHLEGLMPADPTFEADPDMEAGDGGNRDPRRFSEHRHRLSIVSVSERASTLVGSEDLNHFENDLDFQSDTVFDSMRTRVSELTPVRADAIFHLPPPEPSDYPLPIGSGQSLKSYLGSDFTPVKPSSPTPTSLTPQFQGSKISFDDDDDGWSSDWDLPSKSNDGAGDLRVSPAGGLRPFSGLLSSHLGLNSHSNASNSSFGTAPEGFSVDGSSVRETSSILEWSESISTNNTPAILARRSKTIHAKESLLAATRTGRRAPSHHIRSQSMPVVNTLQRVPLPSENWDEDFLDDDEDDGFGLPRNEMVIPRAIEERQASVIGHLGCVREFALLVEDLKRLRDAATYLGLTNGIHKHLWEEAEGIIALATLDDDDMIPSTHNDKMQHRSSWHSPSRHSEMTAEDDNQTRSTPRNRRQSSILLPDDDVFGGNIPATPSFPHLRHNFRNPPSSSSPSPLSRKVIDKNDPVEVAKGIMERMQLQHRQRSDHVISAGKAKAGLASGAYQFDTDMLRELVVHVGGLKRDLAELVDCGDAPSPSLRKHAHFVPSPDVVDSPTTVEAADHGLDISPVKTNFDQECCGSGLERARSNNGVDFRPIVGVV